ncbi:hypothetical protein [Mesorhizobium erdmanii]|uniref:hypothetical protein n=1 Tax=Mesorhizobium erdmanii TaxID=1777866 RepID=UPI000A41BCC0|nr:MULTISPECIES: hypothetical protein [Mesorhizobium]
MKFPRDDGNGDARNASEWHDSAAKSSRFPAMPSRLEMALERVTSNEKAVSDGG